MSAKEKKDKDKPETETEETSTEETGEIIRVRHEFVPMPAPTPKEKKGKDAGASSEETDVVEKDADKTGKKGAEKTVAPPADEDPEKKDLREKLIAEQAKTKEYETIIAAEALKAFKEDKDKFLSLITDEKKRKEADDMIGDDPDKLEQAKFLTAFFTQNLQGAGVKVTGTEEGAGANTGEGEGAGKDGKKTGEDGKPATETETETETTDEETDDAGNKPKGKATLPPAITGYGQYKQIVDELYAILLDPEKSQAEKDEANRKIDELFVQMVKGLREHPSTKISISQCPQCGALLTANAKSCPSCGWTHVKPKTA